VARELGDQRLDRTRQPQSPLVIGRALGQLREQVREPMARERQETLVDAIPSIARAMHSVTTSASVILRLAFAARLGRRSSAVQNTAISSRSRSATIEALLGRRWQ
jgi:hypothetical protein